MATDPGQVQQWAALLDSNGVAAGIGVVGTLLGVLATAGITRLGRKNSEKREDMAAWRDRRAAAYNDLLNISDDFLTEANLLTTKLREIPVANAGQHREDYLLQADKVAALALEFSEEVKKVRVAGYAEVHWKATVVEHRMQDLFTVIPAAREVLAWIMQVSHTDHSAVAAAFVKAQNAATAFEIAAMKQVGMHPEKEPSLLPWHRRVRDYLGFA